MICPFSLLNSASGLAKDKEKSFGIDARDDGISPVEGLFLAIYRIMQKFDRFCCKLQCK
jgi:hypothetical protein